MAILLGVPACGGDDPTPASEGPSPAPSAAPESTMSVTTPEPSPTAAPDTPRFDCPNQAEAESTAAEEAEPARGDIDGDGGPEAIFVVGDERGSSGCAGFVVVDLEGRFESAAVSFPDIDPSFGFPSFNATASINDLAGEEIVVNVTTGASTQFVSVYTFDGADLHEVSYEDSSGDAAAAVFGFGGSVGHVEAVDCLPDGRVVVSFATPKGRRYSLVRRFFDPHGAVWAAAGTERSTGSLREVTKHPEFAGSPFLGCS